MAYKAIVSSVNNSSNSEYFLAYNSVFVDLSNNLTTDPFSAVLLFGTDIVSYSASEVFSAIQTKVLAESALQGFGISATDILWNVPNFSQPKSYNNTPNRSIVTGTGATGFQVSPSRESEVSYSPTMVTTASISGNASDVIVLEICATNSATAANWQEIGRLTNAQALSLAITLQSVQTTSGCLIGKIPVGWYAKLRAITSGTVSNSFTSGQEVLL